MCLMSYSPPNLLKSINIIIIVLTNYCDLHVGVGHKRSFLYYLLHYLKTFGSSQVTSLLHFPILSQSFDFECLIVAKFFLAKKSATVWTQFHAKSIAGLYFVSYNNFVKCKLKSLFKICWVLRTSIQKYLKPNSPIFIISHHMYSVATNTCRRKVWMTSDHFF